jgi:hypothetical protein
MQFNHPRVQHYVFEHLGDDQTEPPSNHHNLDHNNNLGKYQLPLARLQQADLVEEDVKSPIPLLLIH